MVLTSKYPLRLSKGKHESSISKIEHKNVVLASDLLVETVGNSSSSRFIDNSEHVETGDGSSIFSGLALGVVEVSRNSDDSAGGSASKISLSGLLLQEDD